MVHTPFREGSRWFWTWVDDVLIQGIVLGFGQAQKEAAERGRGQENKKDAHGKVSGTGESVRSWFDPEPPFDPGQFFLQVRDLAGCVLDSPPVRIKLAALVLVKLIEPGLQPQRAVLICGPPHAIDLQLRLDVGQPGT
jgi:hypothetical protein